MSWFRSQSEQAAMLLSQSEQWAEKLRLVEEKHNVLIQRAMVVIEKRFDKPMVESSPYNFFRSPASLKFELWVINQEEKLKNEAEHDKIVKIVQEELAKTKRKK